ncbi:hypothetical protein RHMOL_Rhmol03G0070800 [Rhododendron molle]|uniref:Uncharacterized protein n=1 Tax=Rhododendron molle TaxID=49168 RepID=A0ACC0PB23_RHOML|nr:hypothetical protein RHMOL_Rhmol03G0070800 [Rhododendron molle]
MSLRLVGGTTPLYRAFIFSRTLSTRHLLLSTSAMSNRPNFQGGRRGGGPNSGRGARRGGGRGGGGGGRGGGGGGGRGEQRWWDPVWRAERLRQQAAEMEVLDENEWWGKMEQFKRGAEQELIIKRNYSREDQQILSDMAYQLELYLVFFYESNCFQPCSQIRMSTEIEERVGNLLGSSKCTVPIDNSPSASSQSGKQSMPGVDTSKPGPVSVTDAGKERVSLELKERQEKMKTRDNVKALQSFREKLPAFKVRSEFLKAVAENQVLVVSGETGCGKTTQLPQFILEDEISALHGASCNIICTQPRRISAISVAARISSERGESLGESVGYQIRLESKCSAQTRLLFCTTGVLIRRLVQDPDLTGVSHLLVDEIHERGMNEDFLLIILHDLLPRRPDLRLVLMSATINADLFSKYFGNAPTIHIPGLTFPVAEFFLEDVLEKTRYSIKSEVNNYQGSSRRRGRQQESKKDPLTELFEAWWSQPLNTSVVMKVKEPFLYSSLGGMTYLSCLTKLKQIVFLGIPESFLSFLFMVQCPPSINVKFLIAHLPTRGSRIGVLLSVDNTELRICSISSSLLLENSFFLYFIISDVHWGFDMPLDARHFGCPSSEFRKIVLATNIAESSITIDDVVYVIDCGKAKETSYDALNKLACLLPSWISKASAHQRRGRAGRVQPGVCCRLYPKLIHDAMPQYQLPEILRTPLQELCLTIKSLELGTIGTFLAKALQPPDSLSVQNAIELLKTIGALDDSEELTPLGRHLCTLPLDPNIGKMLLMGSIFQCLNPALTIASALAHRDPFVLPINRKEEADAAKRSFAGDSCSDHIALLKAFEAWKDAKRSGNDRAFCWKNFLSPVTLQMMEDMRNQFLDLLSDIGFVDKSRGANAYNQYSKDLEMVSAILCAGLYPNVVQCKRRGKRTAFYTKEVGAVDIHPASVNAGVHLFPLPYMVYSEKKLRGELDKLLNKKIEEPGLDISVEGKGVVAAVIELLHHT